MATIFTRIINGEIPCYKIAEDENYFAFLDISPVQKGHTLVIPKVETDYIFSLDDQTLAGLTLFAKKVAAAIEKAIPCKRIGVAVMGMEVPHAHIHLVPIQNEGDLNFAKAHLKLEPAEMEAIAEKIRKAF
ncbi:MAG: HIT family protein [Paludibacteraceae bacterium]|nr:HIT family protein [Paludibacteraceae bacterium]